MQPRAPDLYRNPLHVPGAGGCRRPADTGARERGRRASHGRHRRGDRAQAQGPRLRHRPAPRPLLRQPAHEHDRRIAPGLPTSARRRRRYRRKGSPFRASA